MTDSYKYLDLTDSILLNTFINMHPYTPYASYNVINENYLFLLIPHLIFLARLLSYLPIYLFMFFSFMIYTSVYIFFECNKFECNF